jgi:cytochrome c1
VVASGHSPPGRSDGGPDAELHGVRLVGHLDQREPGAFNAPSRNVGGDHTWAPAADAAVFSAAACNTGAAPVAVSSAACGAASIGLSWC